MFSDTIIMLDSLCLLLTKNNLKFRKKINETRQFNQVFSKRKNNTDYKI